MRASPIVRLSVVVVTGGGRVLRHEHVEGVLGHGEVLRGSRHNFPIYVDGEVGLRLQPYPRGPEVVHTVGLDEVPAPEVTDGSDEVPPPSQVYGVDVERLVVYARLEGDDHAPAVEAPVADGDLQEAVVLDGLVVPFREGQLGGERFVFEESPNGGHRIGQGTRALLQPGREGPRGLHTEAHRRDVHVEIVPGEAEVDVDHLAVRYELAGFLDVLGDVERPGEVVGRAEG